MHTRNDLPEGTRAKIIPMLQERLADSIDLMLQVKQAHWNVRGPGFIELHLLFDKIAEETEEYPDLIAERVGQLGGLAEGTIRQASKASKIPDYPTRITTCKDHAAALATALSSFAALARKSIADATEAEDAVTADILTEITRGLDKNMWFVEAHTQAER